MTREESAIISAYTGILAGPFEAMHEYAEKLFDRSVFTHEFASARFTEELKAKARPDFIKLAEGVK
jgi:hypothetical protein